MYRTLDIADSNLCYLCYEMNECYFLQNSILVYNMELESMKEYNGRRLLQYFQELVFSYSQIVTSSLSFWNLIIHAQ